MTSYSGKRLVPEVMGARRALFSSADLRHRGDREKLTEGRDSSEPLWGGGLRQSEAIIILLIIILLNSG